jgi:hypothetical protein
MTQTSTSPAPTALSRLGARWPTAAAVAVAALTVYDLDDGTDLAPALAASGLVYLGAAAARRPAAAWPVFGATFVLITIGKLTGADPTIVLLAVAALTAVVGLVHAGLRPPHAVPMQLLGMAVAGGLAAGALVVAPTVGAFLVAAGLLGHAAWDVHHHRTGRVVSGSLAEFCFVIDTLLASAIVVLTAAT